MAPSLEFQHLILLASEMDHIWSRPCVRCIIIYCSILGCGEEEVAEPLAAVASSSSFAFASRPLGTVPVPVVSTLKFSGWWGTVSMRVEWVIL